MLLHQSDKDMTTLKKGKAKLIYNNNKIQSNKTFKENLQSQEVSKIKNNFNK
jgi:hypothetical protein